MLCYAMLCYAMLCYVMSCHVMLCYAMRCNAYVMLMLCLCFVMREDFWKGLCNEMVPLPTERLHAAAEHVAVPDRSIGVYQ